MKTENGYINVTGGKIFWKSIGEGSKTPILTMHGGPGSSHDLFVEPFEELADDRKIIFYDQLGGGRSDRPEDQSLWTIPRFIEEIDILRNELDLEKIILWGSSWGTMLGADYLFTNPKGIEAAIFCSPCLSAKKWKEDADRLRLKLPQDVQEVLLKHEHDQTTDSDEYQEAMWEYLKRFACLLDPIPENLMEVFGNANQEIYEYMWGPSEFHPTGTLKEYDATPKLSTLQMPTLFVCGREDEATPESTEYYSSLVKNSKFEVIEGAAHLAYIEKPNEFIQVMRDFLESLN